MNKNTILNWALIVAAVAFVVAGIKYYNKSKTVRSHQVLISQFDNLRNSEQLMQALLTETMSYAKTNPAIKPTLDAILNKAPAQPAPAKPAAK
jgi:cell shape-determining protein MreC